MPPIGESHYFFREVTALVQKIAISDDFIDLDAVAATRGALWPTVTAVARLVGSCDPLSPSAPLPHALLYGGGVRDLLLGARLKDADMQVYGIDPLVLERKLHEAFPGQVERAGLEYQILKIRLSKTLDVDISVPRRRTAGVSLHEDGDPYLFPLEASRYRDFTINSMSLDPLTGVIYDPFDGIGDLKRKTLRAVDPDTFSQRPVHVLRGCQFAARFGLNPDPATWELCERIARSPTQIGAIPLNAVREEVRKLLGHAKMPSQGIEMLIRLRLLGKYFPALAQALRSPRTQAHWLKAIDRGATLIKDCRLYPDHGQIAMLALFCSPIDVPKERDEIVDTINNMLTPLCFSGHSRASVAEILLALPRLDEVGKPPPRAPGRGRPGFRATTASSAINSGLLTQVAFVPWQALAIVAASRGGRSAIDLLREFEGEHATMREGTGKIPPSILRPEEIAELLAHHPIEVQNEALSALVEARYEIVTRRRAQAAISRGMPQKQFRAAMESQPESGLSRSAQ